MKRQLLNEVEKIIEFDHDLSESEFLTLKELAKAEDDIYQIQEAISKLIEADIKKDVRLKALKAILSTFRSRERKELLFVLKNSNFVLKLFENDPLDVETLRLLTWDFKLFHQDEIDQIFKTLLEQEEIYHFEIEFIKNLISAKEISKINTLILEELSLSISESESRKDLIETICEYSPQFFAVETQSAISLIHLIALKDSEVFNQILEMILSSKRRNFFFSELNYRLVDENDLSIIEIVYSKADAEIAKEFLTELAISTFDLFDLKEWIERSLEGHDSIRAFFLSLKNKEPKLILEALSEIDVDFSLTDSKGNTILHFAYFFYEKIFDRKTMLSKIRSILDAGIDPNLRNSKGQPLIFLTLARSDIETTQILLDYDIDETIRDRRGRSLFDYVKDPSQFQLLLNFKKLNRAFRFKSKIIQ